MMDAQEALAGLAGVVATAGPLVCACVGETLSERAGVINLSLNGTILLSAMGSFAAAVSSGSLACGFACGAATGALMAATVAFAGIGLRQSQLAVGFVLALIGRDLAYFLGNPYMGLAGPRLAALPIPFLCSVPVLGRIFFRQSTLTYASFCLAILSWLWIFKTRPGLMLRGVGERPAAAFVRGGRVNRLRSAYAVAGGALVGLAGAMYSLGIKAGWKGSISGLDGIGWVALAITVFGNWNPLRAAFGACLFALLQWLGIALEASLPGVPSQVLQVAPFPLMILALLAVNIGDAGWVGRMRAAMPERLRRFFDRGLRSLRSSPPAALGIPFRRD